MDGLVLEGQVVVVLIVGIVVFERPLKQRDGQGERAALRLHGEQGGLPADGHGEFTAARKGEGELRVPVPENVCLCGQGLTLQGKISFPEVPVAENGENQGHTL